MLTIDGADADSPRHDLVCAECGEDHPFELPSDLLEAAIREDVVIFAGAGVSTESRRTMGDTFADRIRAELGNISTALSFPELLSAYEASQGRAQLLQHLRSRF